MQNSHLKRATLKLGTLFCASIFILSLAACGQKGALYLPENNTPVVTSNAQATDDSRQPAISVNPQNPNVTPDKIKKGSANDY